MGKSEGLEREKFLEMCRARIGVVTVWAKANRFNHNYVYAVLNGKTRPSKRFLAAVGAERLPEKYRFLEDDPSDT